MQSFIDNFSKIISTDASACKGFFDFPLDKIESFVVASKRSIRETDLTESIFEEYNWFALKILTPTREYRFNDDARGRFNPEIDHVFPQSPQDLKGLDKSYYKEKVDIVWNMQPIQGDVNQTKSNIDPKEFFTDQYKKKGGGLVIGSGFKHDYNFLPSGTNGEIDFNSPLWDDPIAFIEERKKNMLDFLKSRYNIILK